MRSTLFHIPLEVAGVPLFGFGLLLALWTAVCAVRLGTIWYRRGWSGEIWGEFVMMSLLAAVIAKVLPALCDNAGLPLRGYGVMVFLGVVAGVALAAFRAKKEGFDPELIYSLALWMCVAGIFGARLFYIVEYWDEYQKPTASATVLAIINYTKGGLVVYGALAGAGAATIVFLWRNKLPVLKLCDIIAPSLLVGLALGRVGCFLNGCCYGGQCDLPWAVTFPGNTGSESNPASPPYLKQASTGKLILHGIHFDPDAAAPAIIRSIDNGSPVLPSGLQPGDELAAISVELPGAKRPLEYSAEESPYSRRPVLTVAAVEEALARIESPGTKATFRVFDASGQPATRSWNLTALVPVPARSLPVHPTQLYSAIGALLLALFLLAWYPLRRHEGEVTALLISIYPIMRIFEESIRTDEPLIGRTGMTISQNVSVLMLAAAATLWIFILRGPRLKYDLSRAKVHGKMAAQR
jgi:phosphatidylglycerol---prolipoprotein diacylglyceryl transferase